MHTCILHKPINKAASRRGKEDKSVVHKNKRERGREGEGKYVGEVGIVSGRRKKKEKCREGGNRKVMA